MSLRSHAEQLDCHCIIGMSIPRDDPACLESPSPSLHIQFCPLHKAAEELVERLEQISADCGGDKADFKISRYEVDKIRTLLAKIGGES